MGAPVKKVRDDIPFGLKQHVPAKEHEGVGDPNDEWNWEPKVKRIEIQFDESVASQRTRTNTNGIADVGEYY